MTEIKFAHGDDLGGTGQEHVVILPPRRQGPSFSADLDRTFHQAARHGGCGARRSCSRAHGFARPALEKSNLDRTWAGYTDEGNVGSIGEAGIAFDTRSDPGPVDRKIRYENRALRIADIQDGRVLT